MSGHPTCGFCKLEMGYVCTGASGCVWAELRKAEEAMRRGERAHTTPATEPHPDRENQSSKSAPTGHNVPAGKADGAEIDRLRGECERYMRLHQTQGANIRFLMKERAARDFAVADAVREAVLANMRARWPEVTDGLYQDISAIDLASVIATIKEDAR